MCVSKTKACERWKTDSNGCFFRRFCALLFEAAAAVSTGVVVFPIFIFGVHTYFLLLLPFRHFTLAFLAFFICKIYYFRIKGADSVEIPLSTKTTVGKGLVKIHNISTYFYTFSEGKQNQVFSTVFHFYFTLLCVTWATWSWMAYIYIHFYDLNRRRILIFLVARNPIPNYVLSMNVSIFSFISIFSVRSFVRWFVYPSSAYITYYSVLFVLPEFCLWMRAGVRVFIYICLCARNHAHFFVLFCYFFFIRIRPPPSHSRTHSVQWLRETIPLLSILLHTYTIYRIILARLHTCINKRIPNIHVNGFGYALLMSVFACISFSLSLEVAKKLEQWVAQRNELIIICRSARSTF